MPTLSSPADIGAFVEEQDKENNLSGRMYNTLYRESAGWQNIQSKIPVEGGPNGREDSWGICQIHLPDHPNISKAQALDVRFCVAYTVKQFKEGNARQWTEYRLLYGS